MTRNEQIADRLASLIAAGNPEATAVEIVVNELCREETGYTATEIRNDVLNALDCQEAYRFLHVEPSFPGGAENGRRLFQRACEIAGTAHPFLSDLQQGYLELLREGGLDPEEPDEPEPAPTPQPERPEKITPLPTGGVLTVAPAVQVELNKVPLDELRKLQNVERWRNLSPERAARLKQGFEAL